jgi:hypothetical protein
MPRPDAALEALEAILLEPSDDTEWWVALSAHQRCSLSTARLASALWTGEVSSEVWVWREGMPMWLPVTRVPEFEGTVALPPAPSQPLTPPLLPLRTAPPTPEWTEPAHVESALEDPLSLRVKRAVMALSALAILALFATMYGISSGGAGQEPRPGAAARSTPP